MNGHEGSSNDSGPSRLGLEPPPTPGGTRRRPSRLPVADDVEFELEDIKRYESFSTVDWIVDSTRERARVARAKAREQHSSNAHLANGATSAGWGTLGYAPGERPPRWWPTGSALGRHAWRLTRLAMKGLKGGLDSGVVILVGLFIGLNMAVISIATEWASDLKTGHCRAGWWLNRKFCCWEMMEAAGPGGAQQAPAAIKASVAAAVATAGTNVEVLSEQLANGTVASATRRAAFAGPTALRRAYEVAEFAAKTFYERAESSAGTSAASDMCDDWVPWSSWTFPSFLVYIAFAAAFAAACAYLVRSFAPYAAGSGITEIKCILAGFIIHGFLGVQTLVMKSLGLPLAIASGLSIGKEGPAVHVACCIGNVVSSFFESIDRSQAKMREVLTASSAAGVAVAFGSPIGGVLFSLEEMAYNFPATTMWRSFLCALAATVALSFMNPFRSGKLVLFQVSYDRDWHYFEMIFYVIIGIFGGLYGALVIKYNLQVQAFRRNNLAAYGVSEAVLLAVLTAFVGYWNKFLRIDMSESLEILFRECEGGGDYDNLCQSWAQWQMVNSLLIATVLRTALVVLSYGCKVPAGIFVPSMAIGATFGRMLGILIKAWHNAYPKAAIFSACQPDVPCITPGTYAFLGAAAALAGVTRITAAVVVIMFELTGALTYILPTMIVVMVTKGIGDLYGKGGIAEQTMKFAGYPFLDKDEHNFGLLPVREMMKRMPDVVFSQGMHLSSLEKILDNTYRGFPVVRSQTDRTLLGYVGKTELRYALVKAKRARSSLSNDTWCYFSCEEDGKETQSGGRSQVPSSAIPPSPLMGSKTMTNGAAEAEVAASRSKRRLDVEREGLMPDGGRSDGDDDDEEVDVALFEIPDGGVDGEGDEDSLELGHWVDQSPLSVAPSMPLEVVLDLFKKMGPRVILVTDRQGSLEGLVTVKDLLKHIAAQEHADTLARRAARETNSSTGIEMLPEWTMSDDLTGSLHNFGGDLEKSLTNLWAWARVKAQGLGWVPTSSAPSASRQSGRGRGQQGAEYAELMDRNAGRSDQSSALYDGEGEGGAGEGENGDHRYSHESEATISGARKEGDQFVIE